MLATLFLDTKHEDNLNVMMVLIMSSVIASMFIAIAFAQNRQLRARTSPAAHYRPDHQRPVFSQRPGKD